MTVTLFSSEHQDADQKVSEMFDCIDKQGRGDYLGEAISQLEHSLQAAHLAVEAGADEETILGALLHDIGRFIPEDDKMASMTSSDGTFVGKASHEITGERYLRRLGFSEKVCQLVGAHVIAKRYLAVDKEYYEALSKSSKTTLKYQGGVFNEEQVREAEKDSWLESKLAVRRWDDAAKVPDMQTRDLEFYRAMAVRNLLRGERVMAWSMIEQAV